MNEVVFEYRGVDNLVYAKLIKDTKDELVFGEVKPLAAVAEVGKATESSSESHYYDNAPKIVITSTNADKLTLTVAVLDLFTLAEITGQDYLSDLGALVEGEQTEQYIAVGYRTKGTDGKYRYVWRLKGIFAIPDETSHTEENNTNTNNMQLVWTGVMTNYRFNKTKKSAKSVIVDERTAVFDTEHFFDTVKTPDNLSSSAPLPVEFSPETGTEFEDSQAVMLSCNTPNATIFYQLTSPTGVWREYTEPLTLTETTNIYAVSEINGIRGSMTYARYIKTT